MATIFPLLLALIAHIVLCCSSAIAQSSTTSTHCDEFIKKIADVNSTQNELKKYRVFVDNQLKSLVRNLNANILETAKKAATAELCLEVDETIQNNFDVHVESLAFRKLHSHFLIAKSIEDVRPKPDEDVWRSTAYYRRHIENEQSRAKVEQIKLLIQGGELEKADTLITEITNYGSRRKLQRKLAVAYAKSNQVDKLVILIGSTSRLLGFHGFHDLRDLAGSLATNASLETLIKIGKSISNPRKYSTFVEALIEQRLSRGNTKEAETLLTELPLSAKKHAEQMSKIDQERQYSSKQRNYCGDKTQRQQGLLLIAK